jgi:hypothetical protein
LFWKGSKPAPLLKPERRLWEISISIWRIVENTIRNCRQEIRQDPALSMGPSSRLTRYCTLGLWFFGWSKREMKGQAFSSREAVKTFSLEMWAVMDSGQLLGVFNEWRGLNMLSNQEENIIRNKNALLWLLAHLPKSRGGQLLFSHSVC